MNADKRREKAGERRFRRDGSRRKDDPEPRYEHWCRCSRLPAHTLAVLLLDADPESTVGQWLINCWLSDFEILDRVRAESGTEWVTNLLLQVRDIHRYVDSTYRAHEKFHNLESIDPKVWFEWARDLGLKVPAPFETLVSKPSRAHLEQECLRLRQQVSQLTDDRDASPTWEGFDENAETYPLDLDIAHQAWRAVSLRHDSGRPVKEQIKAWIQEHYPERFSDAALERIAVVCNWEKSGGKPST